MYESKYWKYVSFNDLFPNLRADIERLDTASKGRSVYIWGAATKGCLFLTHCAINNLLIDKVVFAIDQNPQKIGKYLPGSHIPILSPEHLKEILPDVLIIFPWNLVEEISEALSQYSTMRKVVFVPDYREIL